MADPVDLLERGPRFSVNLSPVAEEGRSEAIREISGIVHTGSERSWVDRRLMNKLRLQPRDEDSIPWFTGEPVEVGLYRVDFELFTSNGFVMHRNIEIVAADNLSATVGYAVIIGRDLLKSYQFVYCGDTGESTLTLRGGA